MEKSVRPNHFHKAFHRLLILRPVTAFLARVLHYADTLAWRLTGGRFSLTSLFAGLPTYRITTIGAKSKLPRSLPLVVLPADGKMILIASNFGQAQHPAWYYNLKARPECWVNINSRDRPFLAREAEGEEREQYWDLALSYFAGYAVYQKIAAPRPIPVMVLEGRKELPDS